MRQSWGQHERWLANEMKTRNECAYLAQCALRLLDRSLSAPGSAAFTATACICLVQSLLREHSAFPTVITHHQQQLFAEPANKNERMLVTWSRLLMM
jgi:hypothetical protein